MALLSFRRGNITINGINDAEQFGLRWHRLLLQNAAVPAVHLNAVAAPHLAPALASDVNPAPTNHSEPILDRPMDADSPLAADQVSSAPATDAIGAAPAQDAAAPAGEPAPASHAPFSVPAPLTDSTALPAPQPADAAPPGGFIPRAEAIIWSGPAIMAFPTEARDTGGDTASADEGSAAAPDVAAASDLPGNPDTTAPDLAVAPGAVTRDDLDPVLAAMGSGADHAAPSGATVDISAVFLPPGSSDLGFPGHGLDPGFAFTPQPLPPPPDFI